METQGYSVFSVMGPHAGEDSDAIFERKRDDIRNVGKTFWVIRSNKAKPDMIQEIGSTLRRRSGDPLCAFIAPSAPGGARPTKTSSAASESSADRFAWQALPAGITPVTGLMTPSTCALVFDQLFLQESVVVDLWQFADFFNSVEPVRIRRGASTVCVVRGNTSTHSVRMKSRRRQVMAVGRLVEPFAVWLR